MISSKIVDKVSSAKTIAIIGNGGNLAIAQHMASDMSRHLNKFCFAPDAVHLTALGRFDDWHAAWVGQYACNADVIIGITTRTNGPISQALACFPKSILVAPKQHDLLDTLIINEIHFHTFEIAALQMLYELIKTCGGQLPRLDCQE